MCGQSDIVIAKRVPSERDTLSILVDNEAGILARSGSLPPPGGGSRDAAGDPGRGALAFARRRSACAERPLSRAALRASLDLSPAGRGGR